MKDKILIFVAGLLVGAIIATGVFMIINKNNPRTRGNNFNGRGNSMMDGERRAPTQEELNAAEKTIMEDGSEHYRMPDGREMRRQRIDDGRSSGGSKD